MFRFHKNEPLVFQKSDENIIKQNLLSVYCHLDHNELKVHARFIKMAIESIDRGDSERMISLITSSEVIGGSGSIFDLDLGQEFDIKFLKLLKSIKSAVANNKRLNSTILLLERLEKKRFNDK